MKISIILLLVILILSVLSLLIPFSAESKDIRNITLALAAIVGIPIVILREWMAWKTSNNRTEELLNAIKILTTNKSEDISTQSKIAALYNLEEISRQNQELRDKVMEILSSYIRENSPIEIANNLPPVEEMRTVDDLKQALSPPPEDIVVAFRIIAQRKLSKTTALINLRDCHLQSIKIDNANLSGIDFTNSNLGFCQLQDSNFTTSILYKVNLCNANLQRCVMDDVDLAGCNLSFADLGYSSLKGVNLGGIGAPKNAAGYENYIKMAELYIHSSSAEQENKDTET